MSTIIKIAQLVIAAILIALVLLQEHGSGGVSESFGGGEGGGFYQKRRGMEKVMFIATLVGLVLFAAASLANLFIR